MTNKSYDLNGEWQLRWNDGERGERLARVLSGGVDWSRAWSARVPGSVHETLLELGVIPDPNTATNVLSCRWVEECLWTYRRTFEVPALEPNERAWLIFETLDLAAKVFLNGCQIGTHANAFSPCRLEVSKALTAGSNEVVVELDSGLFFGMNRSGDGLGLRLNHQLTKMPHLRKTQNQFGWDWAPRLINLGIPGSVRLEIADRVQWDRLVVRAELDENLTAGRVHVLVFVENLESVPCEAELAVFFEGTGWQILQALTLQPGMHAYDVTLEVSNPDLWWPTGHGSQNRYSIIAELRVNGRLFRKESRKVGFRHVRVNQETHPIQGRFFVIEINGRPIFCKGGNYVPADLILSRVDRSRHEELIDRALEANCNFLRVWGGGVYESDDFYDLCDERGILVWQDFVFACCKYPVHDEAFLSNVSQEATHQVRRLAHHPSLVVWCGNNEIEWGYWEWGFEKGISFPDHALYHLILPRILKQEDPGRYYQPSSPFSPDGEPPNADHLGDQHPWSLGFGDTDFRKYRDMISRFPNEGGILGPNSLPTLKACLTNGDASLSSFAFELHDNSVSYWDAITPYAPDRMLEEWLGKKMADLTLEDFVYWGGVLQGAGLSEYIKNFRRRMFDSAAAVFWMFNDIWPCSRSWTIVDYYRRRTPAFWPVRRAFAPVVVVVTRENDTVKIFGVNEGETVHAHLRSGVMALAGGFPKDHTMSVVLPANSSTVLTEFPVSEWEALGFDSHVAFAYLFSGTNEIARDCLILPRFHEMQWPHSSVKISRQDGRLVFTSSHFVWRVCLDLDGECPWPDNFFDIYPGIPTVLEWSDSLGEPKVLRVGNDLNQTAR